MMMVSFDGLYGLSSNRSIKWIRYCGCGCCC